MRRFHEGALAAAAIVCVCCATSEQSESRQQATTQGPTAALLDSNLHAFLNAMKTKDPAAAMHAWADHGISYSPNMAPLEGKPAIEKYNAQWLARIQTDTIAVGRDGLLHSGGLAVETGWYYFKGKVAGEPAIDSGRYINIWQYQPDGGWKIVRDMSNSTMPVPSVGRAAAKK